MWAMYKAFCNRKLDIFQLDNSQSVLPASMDEIDTPLPQNGYEAIVFHAGVLLHDAFPSDDTPPTLRPCR